MHFYFEINYLYGLYFKSLDIFNKYDYFQIASHEENFNNVSEKVIFHEI